MNNQNATLNTSSTSFDSWDYSASVERVAKRKLPANGMTLTSVDMAYNKLISGCCTEVRNEFPSMFAKRDTQGNIIDAVNRLPDEVFEKIAAAVNSFIDDKIKAVFTDKRDELTRMSSRPIHISAKHNIKVRHTLVRDEVISLDHKITYCNAFISNCERSIAGINAQSSVLSEKTEQRLVKLNKSLVKFNNTLEELRRQKAALAGLEKK